MARASPPGKGGAGAGMAAFQLKTIWPSPRLRLSLAKLGCESGRGPRKEKSDRDTGSKNAVPGRSQKGAVFSLRV